jgi:hypothetical protein
MDVVYAVECGSENRHFEQIVIYQNLNYRFLTYMYMPIAHAFNT